jgi:16S rRNA (guanine(1405)-N(7))-methyltransferase
MDNRFESQLEQLLAQVLANRKYSSILPDLIKEIGSRELQKRGSFKEAVKETKTKLHQAAGVYVDREINYDDWLYLIKNIPPDDLAQIKNACKQIMLQHTSTRERIPGLDEFYQTIFSRISPFSSILDIACGMNPLTIPWMRLSSQHFYRGWDVNQNMIKFLGEAVSKFDTPCLIEAVDIFSVNEFPKLILFFCLKLFPAWSKCKKGSARFYSTGFEQEI